MKILICTATEIEVDKSYFNEIQNLGKHQIDLLITGIGVLATTYMLTKKISFTKPELIINAGIAGSFKKDFHIGKVVQVTEDIIADLGFDEEFGFKHIFDFDKSQGWIKNKTLVNFNLPSAKGITVNTITNSNKKILELKKLFNPDIETMESYAYFFICQNEKIPLIALRSISNKSGVRDKTYWNISLAVHNLWLTLKNILNKINDKDFVKHITMS